MDEDGSKNFNFPWARHLISLYSLIFDVANMVKVVGKALEHYVNDNPQLLDEIIINNYYVSGLVHISDNSRRAKQKRSK